MKSRTSSILAVTVLSLFSAASFVNAQQPAPSPKPSKPADSAVVAAGDDAGGYTIISSLEFGYRGTAVDGDRNKYNSDLNYKAGPRVFDSSFLMKSKEGEGGFFDTLLVTATGFGGDPNGQIRWNMENSEWYRFEGNYRRFKYFRYLNTLANPNWVFSPAQFSVPPNPVTGEHGIDTRTKLADFDLTILPKNRIIRFNVGYSPERFDGPAYTNYHSGGNEFNFLSELRSRADDYRVGAEGQVGPVDWTFLQGWRRFRDDSFISLGPTRGINRNPAVAALTSFTRNEPTRGSVDFTRFSAHTLIAKRLDITGRIIHSKANSDYTFAENSTGVNWNPRVTGWPPTPPAATPNILNLGQYNITGDAERPNTVGDIAGTWLVTDKLRISDTFRVEDFKIDGNAVFADFFSITRGSGATLRTDTIAFSNLDAHRRTEYRKYQNTIEGDYQFNAGNAVHFGYRYGKRRIVESFEGFNLGSNGSVSPPPARSSEFEEEENHTHAFLGGFRVRPVQDWTVYFDAEHGTADNVFTRIGNYDYTNIRAKSRYSPNKDVIFNVAFILRSNANPSEIAGVSIEDFGVSTKSRVFTSSVDWTASSSVSINAGYNYNWVNSDAVVDYFYNSIRHPLGHSIYYMRNHFFFVDTTVRLAPRATLYTSYRVNDDNGQGTRLANPTGNPGYLVSSYPMTYQSPEVRLALKINRHLDWNVGYQYYNYNESELVGPRPQNYHAHLPYTSLRIYFGRKE
jgi:hypothetical protein